MTVKTTVLKQEWYDQNLDMKSKESPAGRPNNFRLFYLSGRVRHEHKIAHILLMLSKLRLTHAVTHKLDNFIRGNPYLNLERRHAFRRKYWRCVTAIT